MSKQKFKVGDRVVVNRKYLNPNHNNYMIGCKEITHTKNCKGENRITYFVLGVWFFSYHLDMWTEDSCSFCLKRFKCWTN